VQAVLGVLVGVGVTVGPNICPGAQPDTIQLSARTSTTVIRCLVFIFSPALSQAQFLVMKNALH